MTTASEKAAKLRAALAIAEKAVKAERDEARRKRQQEEREAIIREVDEYREENCDAAAGDAKSWFGINTGWSEGDVEITHYEYTRSQGSVGLSQDDLKDFIAKLSTFVK